MNIQPVRSWLRDNAVQLAAYVVATVAFLIVMRETTIRNTDNIEKIEARQAQTAALLAHASRDIATASATLEALSVQVQHNTGRIDSLQDRLMRLP